MLGASSVGKVLQLLCNAVKLHRHRPCVCKLYHADGREDQQTEDPGALTRLLRPKAERRWRTLGMEVEAVDAAVGTGQPGSSKQRT